MSQNKVVLTGSLRVRTAPSESIPGGVVTALLAGESRFVQTSTLCLTSVQGDLQADGLATGFYEFATVVDTDGVAFDEFLLELDTSIQEQSLANNRDTILVTSSPDLELQDVSVSQATNDTLVISGFIQNSGNGVARIDSLPWETRHELFIPLGNQALTGLVWRDTNEDSLPNEDLGVAGLSGARVYAYRPSGESLVAAATDAMGRFTLEGLPLGELRVELDLQSIPASLRSSSNTFTRTMTIVLGDSLSSLNFGLVEEPDSPCATVVTWRPSPGAAQVLSEPGTTGVFSFASAQTMLEPGERVPFQVESSVPIRSNNWVQVESTSTSFRSVEFEAGRFWAVGSNSSNLYRSIDGIIWEAIGLGEQAGWNDTAANTNGNVYVVAKESPNQGVVSSDGGESFGPVVTNAAWEVAFGHGVLVSVYPFSEGGSGMSVVGLSNDGGRIWIRNPNEQRFFRVSFLNGNFLTTASVETGRSSDGVNWLRSNRLVLAGENYNARGSILYDGTQYVLPVGSANNLQVVVSSDALNWSFIDPVIPEERIGSMAFGGGVYAVIGITDEVYSIYTSSNLIDWSLDHRFDGGVRIEDIAFGNGAFVAVDLIGKAIYAKPPRTFNVAGLLSIKLDPDDFIVEQPLSTQGDQNNRATVLLPADFIGN